jgi:azurin
MVGTNFCLLGCNTEDIEKAKSLFLTFSGKKILEKNVYGEVIENTTDVADIYINGVKVAEESNFLFSYNITSLTTQLKKALNRERSNVGRSAYTGRIKDILKTCSSEMVINSLVNDLQQFGIGNIHDELSWNDISMYASIKMSQLHKNTTFVTTSDLQNNPSLIDEMQRSGYNPVVVPHNIISKMEDYNTGTKNGETLTTATQYFKDEKERFVPTPVNINSLTVQEKQVYSKTDAILNLIGGKPKNVKTITIVERLYEADMLGILGLWVSEKNEIMIKRSQLHSISQYAGTLLHECAHAVSGAGDVSRDFELKLTEIIGIISSKLI